MLSEVENGNISLTDTYRLEAEDVVGGAGSLQYKEVGTLVTYRELLEKGAPSSRTQWL